MKSRLASSVATSTEPEILILDEVFWVGDASFPKKEKARKAELIASCKILDFVSHSETLVKDLCNKVVVLQDGKVAIQGKLAEAFEFYKEYII